jgi:hypothetical protein
MKKCLNYFKYSGAIDEACLAHLVCEHLLLQQPTRQRR